MYKRKTMQRWLGVISGCFILTATAEKLPPPFETEYSADEVVSEQAGLVGKVVKVKFNRIYYVNKLKTGMYAGNLRTCVKPQDTTYSEKAGLWVCFPTEGLGAVSKFLPKPGASSEEMIALMAAADKESIYVRVDKNARMGCVAVGDQYKKDDEEYKWSEEAEIPDLAAKRKILVSDMMLFPEQLNGKTVELQFCEAGQIKQLSEGEYSTGISCGDGHDRVPIKFPAAGKAFFKEITEQTIGSKVHSVYATVSVDSSGEIELAAKGRRASGSEYRW